VLTLKNIFSSLFLKCTIDKALFLSELVHIDAWGVHASLVSTTLGFQHFQSSVDDLSKCTYMVTFNKITIYQPCIILLKGCYSNDNSGLECGKGGGLIQVILSDFVS